MQIKYNGIQIKCLIPWDFVQTALATTAHAVVKIAFGKEHAAAITVDRDQFTTGSSLDSLDPEVPKYVFTWGDNQRGQLGRPDDGRSRDPNL